MFLLVVCVFGVRFGLTLCAVGFMVVKLVALSVRCYCFGAALFYYVAVCVLAFVGFDCDCWWWLVLGVCFAASFV